MVYFLIVVPLCCLCVFDISDFIVNVFVDTACNLCRHFYSPFKPKVEVLACTHLTHCGEEPYAEAHVLFFF